MARRVLSPEQARALFNVLTHYETYGEIEAFKRSDAIVQYGPPFQPCSTDAQSGSPVLQRLFTRFAVTLPGLDSVSGSFYVDRLLPLVSALSSANLSESYDKGVLGQRKTLATAISSLLEYPARGYFGGYPRNKLLVPDGEYDTSDPQDAEKAWHDLLQLLVYGDAVDRLFIRAAETDQLSQHPTLTRAAHHYILLHVASFLHHILIVSPKGPALLALLESAHKLVPYGVIRQTLRIGNAATMINGMVKIVLAKASVAAVTNWLGVSHGADEGMNLMQTIISTVLAWDMKKLRTQVSQIEKSKGCLSKEQLSLVRAYTEKSQGEQERYRFESKSQSKSMIAIILTFSPSSEPLSLSAHAQASEYMSLLFSIRDREQLISVLCRHSPDLVTPIARDLLSAYDPIIRAIHDAVDLSATVHDLEVFLNDLIKLSKPVPNGGERVSVEKFVALLEKHQGASHRFIHQVVKNGRDVSESFRKYAQSSAEQFRQSGGGTSNAEGAGTMTSTLNTIFGSLSDSDSALILQEVNAYSAYLSYLSSSSSGLAKAVLSNGKPTMNGPGMFLARWQALLDETELPPAQAEGVIRRGGIMEVRQTPRMESTVRLLGQKFREALKGWT